MDMNLTAKSKAKEIIEELGSKKVNGKVVYYELVCGVDYRFLIQDVADALYKNRFKNIRIAWDHQLTEQKEIKKSIEMLLKAGYSRNDIMVFMICNWLIPYETNLRKMDLCKIWNVKIGDCYFDNQTFPNCKPIHWDIYQLKDFRMRVRKHNQMVNFGIDPELKDKGFFQTQADYRRSLNRNLTEDFAKSSQINPSLPQKIPIKDREPKIPNSIIAIILIDVLSSSLLFFFPIFKVPHLQYSFYSFVLVLHYCNIICSATFTKIITFLLSPINRFN